MTTETPSRSPIRMGRVILLSVVGSLVLVGGATGMIFGILAEPEPSVPLIVVGAIVAALSIAGIVLGLRRIVRSFNATSATVIETETAWQDTEDAVRVVIQREPRGLSQQALSLMNTGLFALIVASGQLTRPWNAEAGFRATLTAVGIAVAVTGYVRAKRRGRLVALFPGLADPFSALNLDSRKALGRQLMANEPPTLQTAPLILLTAELQNVRSRAIALPAIGPFLVFTASTLLYSSWVAALMGLAIVSLVIVVAYQRARLRRGAAAARDLLGLR